MIDVGTQLEENTGDVWPLYIPKGRVMKSSGSCYIIAFQRQALRNKESEDLHMLTMWATVEELAAKNDQACVSEIKGGLGAVQIRIGSLSEMLWQEIVISDTIIMPEASVPSRWDRRHHSNNNHQSEKANVD
jgi:hypothetical protein